MNTIAGRAAGSAGGGGAGGSSAVTRLAEDSKSLELSAGIRLASASARDGTGSICADAGCACAGTVSGCSAAAGAGTRAAIERAMNSSRSLCRQVCPHRCLEPARSRLRELQPLTLSSPAVSKTTNQWLVCFFSAPQISHEMAWRITQAPPVPLLSTSYFIAGKRGEDEHRCHNSALLLNAGRIRRPEFQFGTARREPEKRSIPLARNTLSGPKPGTSGRCNRGKSAGTPHLPGNPRAHR